MLHVNMSEQQRKAVKQANAARFDMSTGSGTRVCVRHTDRETERYPVRFLVWLDHI